MELAWLNDFISLAEHRSFSRAADARHVTQPAFSRRVRALEDWIGAPLFVRGAQGASLTPAGETFRPFALALLQELDRARRTTIAAAEQQSTSLAIAATHALSFTFFPGWISRHVDMDTFGKLNLVSDTLEACEAAMASGEVHFLLCHWHQGMTTRLDAQHYESIVVGGDALVAVSAPERGEPLWPVPGRSDRPTRLLTYSPASGLGRILASRPSHRENTAGTEAVFSSHLAAALLAMVRDGKGAAWLPQTLVVDDLASGRLLRAGTVAQDVPLQIRLIRSPMCRNRATDGLWQRLCV